MSDFGVALLFAALYFIFNFLIFTFIKIKRPLVLMTYLFMAFTLAAIIVAQFTTPIAEQEALISIFVSVVFLTLVFGFLQLYGLIERSISLNILVCFLDSAHNALSISELKEKYSFTELIHEKIEGALKMKIISEPQPQRYVLTFKGKCIAYIAYKMKTILNWGKGG